MSDRNDVTSRDYDLLAEALARALSQWWRARQNETAGCGEPAVGGGAAVSGGAEPLAAVPSITRSAQQEQRRTHGSDVDGHVPFANGGVHDGRAA